MRSWSVSTLVLGLVATAMLAAQSPMRPGRWQVTVQMQMANMAMPATTGTQCITADQLQKDPNAGLPNGSPGQPSACKVTDLKTMGNTTSWKMACQGPPATTGDAELTFMGDSYAGTLKMTTPQGQMTMKLTGKRVGDCTS